MANSAIESSSVPRLSQIRQTSTSSSNIPIAPQQPSSTQMMAAFQVSTVLFVVHWFYTCTWPLHCLNLAGVILQAQLAELQAQQMAQAEAHQRQLEAVQQQSARQLEAVQQHSARQLQDVATYFQGLQIPGLVLPPLPPSLFAPPPPPSPTGTPVSIYGCLLL